MCPVLFTVEGTVRRRRMMDVARRRRMVDVARRRRVVDVARRRRYDYWWRRWRRYDNRRCSVDNCRSGLVNDLCRRRGDYYSARRCGHRSAHNGSGNGAGSKGQASSRVRIGGCRAGDSDAANGGNNLLVHVFFLSFKLTVKETKYETGLLYSV